MYDEATAKRILERAIALDAAQNTGMSREDILQIASEIGVSHASVDRAMEERRLSTTPSKSSLPSALSPLKLLGLGSALGLTSSLLTVAGVSVYMKGYEMSFPVTGASALFHGGLIMLSGALSVLPGMRRSGPFLERNVAVWLGAGFGSMVAFESLAPIVGGVASLGVLWQYGFALLTTSVAGCCVLAYRSKGKAQDTDDTLGGAAANKLSIRSRAIRMLRRWLDRMEAIRVVLRGYGHDTHTAKSRPAF